MDELRFDAWTRRRFGLTMGSGVGAALGLSPRDDAVARNKKKKKRCRKFDAGCKPTGKKTCCKGLSCEESIKGGNRCCKKLGTTCVDGSECCGDGICDNVEPEGNTVCCHLTGGFCRGDFDCCGDLLCAEGLDQCVQT
jgi:hypothetical protein